MRARLVAQAALLAAVALHVLAPVASAATVRVPADYPSIQAAINAIVNGAVADASVIEVQPGTYSEALTIANTGKSMTIVGVAGPASTVVNASAFAMTALRILAATGTVRIEGITIRGGNGNAGELVGGGFAFHDSSPILTNVIIENNVGFDSAGGVMFRSNPTFANCIIRNNVAQRFGGGLVIVLGSQPVFTNCHIVNNQSGTASNIGSGGGVHVNDASPTFRGCIIANNRSKFAAGGIMHLGRYDSAYGVSRMVLEDTSVRDNVAERFSPADNPAEGGGVHIEDNAVASLIRTTVTGNSANTGGGLSSYRARYEIISSRVEGNHAQDGYPFGLGGGIALGSNNVAPPFRPGASLVLVDSVVRGNDAREAGGIMATGDQVCGGACNPSTAIRAVVQVSESLIADNTTTFGSGGMRFDRVDLTMINAHVFGNTASDAGSFGGGILLALGTNATLDNITVARNAAGAFGGGLFVDGGAVVSLANSRVYANTANSGGGMFVGQSGPPSGTVQNTTIADNSNYQIHEQACAVPRTILVYANNFITPRSGFSDLYTSTCGGATTTILAFNTLPSGRAFGNTSPAPSFVVFLATPDTDRSVLSWSVSRAGSVTISGVGSFSGHTSTTVVNPAPTTTYFLTSAGGPPLPAAQTVLWAPQWGLPTDLPVRGDFDGDGRDDVGVFRGVDGTWYVALATGSVIQQPWGWPGDVPVPADYDGDGKADLGVFRPSTNTWYVRLSAGGVLVAPWGQAGDTVVPGDYDGDGRADVAVYRRSTGQWFIRWSSGGTATLVWGQADRGDVPMPADYDGDGRTDTGVYRTSTGEWLIWRSSQGALSIVWGTPMSMRLNDIPLTADFDGDGRADVVVVRGTTGDWYIRKSTGSTEVRRFGVGDARVPADYAGTNRAKIAIYRAATGTWLIAP